MRWHQGQRGGVSNLIRRFTYLIQVKVVLFTVIFTVVSCVKDRNGLANLLEVFLLCVGETTS